MFGLRFTLFTGLVSLLYQFLPGRGYILPVFRLHLWDRGTAGAVELAGVNIYDIGGKGGGTAGAVFGGIASLMGGCLLYTSDAADEL